LAVVAGRATGADPIRVVIDADTAEHPSVEALVRELRSVVSLHKGSARLEIVVRAGDAETALECGELHRVARSAGLLAEIEGIAGIEMAAGVSANGGGGGW
ncbi:MAG: hypothetical protein JJE27_08755, partial [Thermoleophilia bacterium]|nr:hypothetical protein [Thermoleophilia bacterium]